MPCPAAVAMVPAAAVFGVPAVRASKSDRATNRHEHCRKQTSHFFILKNVCSSTRYKHSSGDDVNRCVFRRRDRDRYRLGFRRRRRCAAGPFGDELVVYVDVASRVDAREATVSGILPQPLCRPACLTLRRRTVPREPKTTRAKKHRLLSRVFLSRCCQNRSRIAPVDRERFRRSRSILALSLSTLSCPRCLPNPNKRASRDCWPRELQALVHRTP